MPRREFRGVVISAGKMQKTIKVIVEMLKKHPVYRKYVRKTRKYLVHDPENKAKEGDVVIIREGRPFSKMKRFYLVKIIGHKEAGVEHISSEAPEGGEGVGGEEEEEVGGERA